MTALDIMMGALKQSMVQTVKLKRLSRSYHRSELAWLVKVEPVAIEIVGVAILFWMIRPSCKLMMLPLKSSVR